MDRAKALFAVSEANRSNGQYLNDMERFTLLRNENYNQKNIQACSLYLSLQCKEKIQVLLNGYKLHA